MLRTTFTHVRGQWAGLLALFLVLTGGAAYAGGLIGSDDIDRNAVLSKHIKRANVKGSDIAANAVTSAQVVDGGLLAQDFGPGQLPPGPAGPTGPSGSPDTGAEILGKLAPLDGNGSGLDADLLDGRSASTFANSADIHLIDTVGVDDPTPGDVDPGIATLVSDEGITLELRCTENFAGGGDDIIAIRLDFPAEGAYVRMDATTGDSVEGNVSSLAVLSLASQNAGRTIAGVDFVATSMNPGGESFSGHIVVETTESITTSPDCSAGGVAMG